MLWNVTTPPANLPLTWQQIKSHIKPNDEEQSYVLDLLASATSHAEEKMECSLIPRTITATFDRNDVGEFDSLDQWTTYPYWCHTHRGFWIPRGPIISITSVVDANNAAVPYKTQQDGNRFTVIPTVPIHGRLPITIVYQAGYSAVPADILNAIRVHTATMYRYREDITATQANAVHKLDDFYQFRGRGTVVA